MAFDLFSFLDTFDVEAYASERIAAFRADVRVSQGLAPIVPAHLLPEGVCQVLADEVSVNGPAKSIVTRASVLAGIVERAIELASIVSPVRWLFQRRAGRAIWALTAEMLKYASRWGIILALSMEKESCWIPICSSGAYAVGIEQVLTKNGALKAPNHGVQPHVAEEPKTNLPLQMEVAEELDTNLPVQLGVAEEHSTNLEVQLPIAGELGTQFIECTEAFFDALLEEEQEVQTSVSGLWPDKTVFVPVNEQFTKRGDENYAEWCAEVPWFVTTREYESLCEIFDLSEMNLSLHGNWPCHLPAVPSELLDVSSPNHEFDMGWGVPEVTTFDINRLIMAIFKLTCCKEMKQSSAVVCSPFIEYYHDSLVGPFANPILYPNGCGPIDRPIWQGCRNAPYSLIKFPPFIGDLTFLFGEVSSLDFVFSSEEEDEFVDCDPDEDDINNIVPARIFERCPYEAFPRVYKRVAYKPRIFEKVEKVYVSPSLRQKCAISMHNCWDRRLKNAYLEDCIYCAFDALDRRELLFTQLSLHTDWLPAQKLKTAGPPPMGAMGRLTQLHSIGSTNFKAAANMLFAFAHSEREQEEVSAKLADKAEEDHDKYWSSIDSVKSQLKKKKGKKVPNSSEGMLGDKKTKLVEKDVFTKVVHGGFMDKVRYRFQTDSAHLLTEQTFPLRDENVYVGANKGVPIYTRLPTFSEAELRKLKDKAEMSNTEVVALDMAIQSHVPQGTPMVAFSTIMDGRTDDPHVAAQCGSYFDLGRGRCQALSLPLVNFNLNDLFKRLGNDDPELYLATYFNDTQGYRAGELVFTYGSSELLEHKPDAYTNKSLCKDSWDDILKRNVLKGNRIVKGFNVIDTISQDFDQEIPEFGEVNFITKPSSSVMPTKAFTAKGIKENTMGRPLQRTCSMARVPFGRVPTRNLTSFGGIGVQVQRTDIGVTPSNMQAPRMSDFHSEREYGVVITKTLEVPKDAKKGTHLGSIDLYQEARIQRKLAYRQCLLTGLTDPKILIRVNSPINPFCGLTIGIVADYFSRVDPVGKLAGKLPPLLGNSMPQYLHCVGQSGFSEFLLDTTQELGHSLYMVNRGIATPMFHFYLYEDNAVTAAEKWQITVEILLRQIDEVEEAVDSPILTVPYNVNNTFLVQKRYLGPASFKLGLSNPILTSSIGLADLETYSGTKQCLGMYAAMTRLLQGTGGRINGTIRKLGSSFVSGSMRMLFWFGPAYPTLEDSSNYPHLDFILEGEKPFSLEIRAPMARAPLRGRDGKMVFYLLGGPLAAKGVSSDLSFSIYIEGISEAVVPSHVQYMDQDVVWAQVEGLFPDSGHIFVPNHICDWKPSDVTVIMRENPISAIFGACGFFKGRVSMTIQWVANGKLADTGSAVWVGKCFGTSRSHDILETYTSNVYIPGSCSFELDVGDFTGCNIPGGTGNSLQFIKIWVEKGSNVGHFRISIRLLPGFAFYGRSVLLTGT
uniref:Polyprotein n=1 Tax=Mirobolan latent ringspot virus TaxID=3072196 RepID=A0AA51RAH1_9SECO|nr:polyprotein [Mirobolan latent ringspot virus]